MICKRLFDHHHIEAIEDNLGVLNSVYNFCIRISVSGLTLTSLPTMKHVNKRPAETPAPDAHPDKKCRLFEDVHTLSVLLRHTQLSQNCVAILRLTAKTFPTVLPSAPINVSDIVLDGHLALLEYCHIKLGCKLRGRLCAVAAQYGRLDVLVWLRGNGCPWDCTVTAQAAYHGHLDLLKWALRNGSGECGLDATVCNSAAAGGKIHVLMYAMQHFGNPFENFDIEGNLQKDPPVIQKWNTSTCAAAAAFNRLDTLVFLRENGCPCDPLTIQEAERLERQN